MNQDFVALIGILVEIGSSLLFGKFGGMLMLIVPYSIVLSFVSTTLGGVFWGYTLAQTAAKLNPIIALGRN